MVDHHPSESIVYLGSSVDNVFSGWQSTMSPYKECDIFAPPPPLKKVGHIALHMSVGLYGGIPNLVQLITQECFDPEASNLVGR